MWGEGGPREIKEFAQGHKNDKFSFRLFCVFFSQNLDPTVYSCFFAHIKMGNEEKESSWEMNIGKE